ncbi:unannotated protein [freshwater metagenome]|uniref:Unannotated protein n=1 Tax=freshwater metagenome TaxID=449393 RepID=A0A6J7BB18_9ZZZZ|nr:AMP-binding protein [Actinomycetota bacterium]
MSNSPYFDSFDTSEFSKSFPSGRDFINQYEGMSRDELRSIQESEFQKVLALAWATPFYQSTWKAAGVGVGDIKSLEDLHLLPLVDKTAILNDVEAFPPFGSLALPATGKSGPRVVQTTSGTTGAPQPVVWGPWGREVQNLLLGRTYRWLGVNADDVVHGVYGHGLINGGHYIRESIIRYTEATYISAGTGAETRSERQVELIKRFGATVLVGFSDYLLRLAEVVREQGLDPVKDLNVRMIIGHLPEGGRKKLEDAWGGVPAFNWYGVADTGILSTEGPERDGLYIWEDANFVEVLDSETHAPTPRGETGELVVTSLAKSDLAPLIRFNTHDLTALLPGHGSANMPFDRMAGLLGRSDNMVKLRGINVYPTALSAILVNIPGFSGEYFARLEKAPSGSDHLVVVVEVREQSESIRLQIEDHLSATLGLKIGAEIVGVGETAEITQLTTRQKPIRLVDARA